MNFKEMALKELSEINKILNFSASVYQSAQSHIESDADSHEHMKVNEFVDLCLDMARIDN